jgi:hypothetical protein
MHFTPKQFWKSTPSKIMILWEEYLRLNGKLEEKETPQGEQIVYHEGKAYKKVSPQNSTALRNM